MACGEDWPVAHGSRFAVSVINAVDVVLFSKDVDTTTHGRENLK